MPEGKEIMGLVEKGLNDSTIGKEVVKKTSDMMEPLRWAHVTFSGSHIGERGDRSPHRGVHDVVTNGEHFSPDYYLKQNAQRGPWRSYFRTYGMLEVQETLTLSIVLLIY